MRPPALGACENYLAVWRRNTLRPVAAPVYFAPLFEGANFMSQHRSLKGLGAIVAKRNVLKRFERVEVLQKRGVFKPGQKVIGLPKTKPLE